MSHPLPRTARRGEAGYTLLELMIVVFVMGAIMSILIYGMRQYLRQAAQKGSEAVILSVKAALDQYYSTYREYPPDGYDFDVKKASSGSMVKIKGSQCLVYYLGFPTMQMVEVGQDMRIQERPPFLEITADMLSGPTDMDLDDKLKQPNAEIVDKYGNAIHYDNVAQKNDKGDVKDMAAEQVDTHLQGGEMVQAPDPRKPKKGAASGATASGAGIARNKGAYDLWSHGFDILDTSDDITNWK